MIEIQIYDFSNLQRGKNRSLILFTNNVIDFYDDMLMKQLDPYILWGEGIVIKCIIFEVHNIRFKEVSYSLDEFSISNRTTKISQNMFKLIIAIKYRNASLALLLS